MTKILCAIRGGEASFETQDKAIALAKEQNAELLFLYVFDTAFMDKTIRAFRKETIERELDHMGEFLLMMALERAKKQDMNASLLIRHGVFRVELVDVAKSEGVDILVLGRPAGEGSLFSQDEITVFAQEIAEEAGIEVQVR